MWLLKQLSRRLVSMRLNTSTPLYEELHPATTDKYGDDFYVFGEFWNDEQSNNDYLASIDYQLVDVALQNLFRCQLLRKPI